MPCGSGHGQRTKNPRPVIFHGHWRGEGLHADEMHRPDADAITPVPPPNKVHRSCPRVAVTRSARNSATHDSETQSAPKLLLQRSYTRSAAPDGRTAPSMEFACEAILRQDLRQRPHRPAAPRALRATGSIAPKVARDAADRLWAAMNGLPAAAYWATFLRLEAI